MANKISKMRKKIIVVAIPLFFVAMGYVLLRFSDGPLGPIVGGRLKAGVLVQESISDWSFVEGGQNIEIQLKSSNWSRTTGVGVINGDLYISADLGVLTS